MCPGAGGGIRKECSHELKLWQTPDTLAQPARMCAKKESEVLAPTELPPVKLTERPDYTPPPSLAVPPVAGGKSVVQPGPITPGTLPIPATDKVEFKSSAPAPIAIPIPTTDVRPLESSSTPLFIQQTSNLQDARPIPLPAPR